MTNKGAYVWQKVGEANFIKGKDFQKVPKWIQRRIPQLLHDRPLVATEAYITWYLKGRHFRYKIMYSEYYGLTIYRKPRSRK